MKSFNSLGLLPQLIEALTDLGYENPTPIQSGAIPFLLNNNQDLIATAQTGTGKTASFGLPVIQNIDIDNNNTQVFILAPTRELCLQITADLKSYSKYIKQIKIVAIYGGASVVPQKTALKKGAHIVVATPGRAVDLLNRKNLRLDQINQFILDEADEMLDMGFKDDLERLLTASNPNKQTILFSATMAKKVKALTKKYMVEPKEVSVARNNEGAKDIRHLLHIAGGKNRFEVLKRTVDLNPEIYGIIFCRTRRETKDIAKNLISDGYVAEALHGELSQAQRDDVMKKFREGITKLLVATDVASRGLDVSDLTHVINYNLPDEPEVYIHRSGRTGRAGKEGISIAIISPREKSKIKTIERMGGFTFTEAKIPSGQEICKMQLNRYLDKVQKSSIEESEMASYLKTALERFKDDTKEEVIEKFISSELSRILSHYKNSEDLNKASSRGKERNNKGQSKSKKQSKKNGRNGSTDFVKIHINLGSKNKMNPGRLMAFINETLDSSKAEIGKIEILNTFSFFEIEKGFDKELIEKVSQYELHGKKLKLEVAAAAKKNSHENGRFTKKRKKRNKRR